MKYGTLRMNCFSRSLLKLDYDYKKLYYYNYFYVNLTYFKVINIQKVKSNNFIN